MMIGAAILAVSACQREHPNREDPAIRAGSTQVYKCADGYRFVARFEPERVWLFLSDRTVSLPQVPAASGFQFTNGELTLRGEGARTRLDAEAAPHGPCVNQPEEVPWENARLSGVAFRAVGDRPSWSLEISRGAGIVFIREGAAPDRFATATPESIGGKTTYVAQAAGRTLRIVLEPGECRRSPGEDGFDATVNISFEGQEYRGCGRALR